MDKQSVYLREETRLDEIPTALTRGPGITLLIHGRELDKGAVLPQRDI